MITIHSTTVNHLPLKYPKVEKSISIIHSSRQPGKVGSNPIRIISDNDTINARKVYLHIYICIPTILWYLSNKLSAEYCFGFLPTGFTREGDTVVTI